MDLISKLLEKIGLGLPFSGLPFVFSTGGGVNALPTIEHALRFNSASSQYLSKTPGSTTNRRTWIFSDWVKRGKLGATQTLIGATGSSRVTYIHFDSSDRLVIYSATAAGGGDGGEYISNRVFRDPTAHLHIVVAYDSTNATAGNRIRVWVNNEQITSWATSTAPTLNHDSQFNWTGATMEIGRYNATNYFEGYRSRVALVDGSTADATSFAYTDPNNQWRTLPASQVKAVVDAGGTNSFMLDFDDGTSTVTLGNDYSSKNNDWTLNSFTRSAGPSDCWMIDTPTNNFATLNPLVQAGSTYSPQVPTGANLNIGGGSSRSWSAATQSVATGKWYAEYVVTLAASGYPIFGVWTGQVTGSDAYPGHLGSTGAAYEQNGSRDVNGTNTAGWAATFTTNDIISVAIDADTGKVWFAKNGAWLASGDPAAGTNAAATLSSPQYTFGASASSSSGATASANFGQAALTASAAYDSASGGWFRYTPPTGFKALCTANLPEPTIKLPKQHFDVVARNGFGVTGGSITSLQFKPGLWWEKRRNSTAESHVIVDELRGVGLYLRSDSTAADTVLTYLTSLNSNGYTLGTNDYATGDTLVDWLWKANGAGSSNTAGSITSTVSANTTAGFSIVTYTGTSSTATQTIGHGLGVAPELIIVKNRSGVYAWPVYHANMAVSVPHTWYMTLNGTAAASNGVNIWQAAPTSSVFSLNGSAVPEVWANTNNYVAYCFAEVEGFSKFGSYTGNGNADGPFVWCGFRPRFLLLKISNPTSAIYDWVILDTARNTYNVMWNPLAANGSAAEYSGGHEYDIDVTATGFKVRSTYAGINENGKTIIFAAFAEWPFKYANAR